MKISEASFSLAVHKLTLFVAALHVFIFEYKAQLQALMPERVFEYVVLGITLLALFAKTFQEPPKKPEPAKEGA